MAIGHLPLENYTPVVRLNEGLYTKKTIQTTSNVVVGGTLAVTGAITASAGVTGQNFAVNYVGQTTEAATDRVIFTAPVACQVVAAVEAHAVAAGGASTLQLVKDTGTGAPGAGTDLLTNNTNTGFDLNATANTVQTGTLTATASSLQLAAGDRLSIDFANAIQSTAGLNITVWMKTI
jgi:hypothetical protein